MRAFDLPHPLDWPRCSLSDREQWLPGRAGVYALIDSEDDHIYYIGKADELSSRWRGRSHHRLEQAENELQDPLIAWRVVDGRSVNQIETQLIRKYKPAWNYTPVPVYRSRKRAFSGSSGATEAGMHPVQIAFSVVVAILIGNTIGHPIAYVIGYFIGAGISHLGKVFLLEKFN